MSDAPPPLSARSKARQKLGFAALVTLLVGASVGVFVADHFWKRVPTVRVMSAFLKAVREGRLDDARALATPSYRLFLVPPGGAGPGTDEGRTLGALRAAGGVSTGDFIGEWTHGCIFGTAAGMHFAAVLRYQDGGWKVDDLCSEVEPDECKEVTKPEGD